MTRAEQAYPSKSELSYVWSYGNVAAKGVSIKPRSSCRRLRHRRRLRQLLRDRALCRTCQF